MKISIPLFISLLIFVSTTAKAQLNNQTKKDQLVKIAKFKPPVVKAYLGRNKDTTTVTVDEAVQLVGLPLKVVDDKKNEYSVTSYGFSYKSRSIVENEETGKKEVKYTTVASNFKESPLPEVWKVNVRRTLKKDEHLFFYDIVVKDKQGRIFFAPNLLIKVN
jgi:hypothetical protein